MKFTLEIDLGNDAMQDFNAVGSALASVSHELKREYAGGLGWVVVDRGIVRDANGNTVGTWRVYE